MAKSEAPKPTQRAHKATYAKDNRNGGYNVRVQGPKANQFAGREVPVTLANGGEHTEKLKKLFWTGTDTGFGDRPGTGEPVALYTFESKPKERQQDAEF